MSNSPSSTRLRALLLAAGCAAVLGLAACGGSDSSSTTSSTTTPVGATGASSTDTGGTATTPTGDASALRDAFNQQLIQVLTTSQGLTQSQAECAINELENSVSDQQLQDAITQAAQTGQPPQDLIDAGFAAGQHCANQ
jgi:ABC-type phosphate transport system substrate-binding protein